MAKILVVWEMGGNLGHIGNLLPVALGLRELGHEVVFCLQKSEYASHLISTHGFLALPAPVLPPLPPNGHPLHSYADILLQIGFGKPESLLQTVKQWRSLFQQQMPDLLLLNAAPTAALAAIGCSFKTILYGNGFDLPPPTSPLPPTRSWVNTPLPQLHLIETRLQDAINWVLAHLKQPVLPTLVDFMQVHERMLITVRELDHYPQRQKEKYWGAWIATGEGQKFSWRNGRKYRVFAYLRAAIIPIEKAIGQMDDRQCEYAIIAPDLDDAQCRRWSNDYLQVLNQPIRLQDAMDDCHLAICHSGMGMMTSFLLHGIPLLMLPNQLEQFIISRNVAQQGVGMMLNPQDTRLPMANAIKQLLAQPQYRHNAKAFAKKYPQQTTSLWMSAILAHLCAAIEKK